MITYITKSFYNTLKRVLGMYVYKQNKVKRFLFNNRRLYETLAVKVRPCRLRNLSRFVAEPYR